MRISDWSSDVCSSDLTLKNIFGYRYTGVSNFQDATGIANAPLPDLGPGLAALGYIPGQPGVLITTRNHSKSEQYTDEIQLSGTAFGDKLSWIVGAFYIKSKPAGVNYLALDIFRPTRSEEHTSELQSLMRISYAVFCLKKKMTIHY